MVASREGGSGCAVSGSALSGVFCDQPFQLSLTVTDCFSNSRSDLPKGTQILARVVQHVQAILLLGTTKALRAHQCHNLDISKSSLLLNHFY